MNYLSFFCLILLSCSNFSENERSNPFDPESKYKLKISFEKSSELRIIGKNYTLKAKVESILDGKTVDQSHLVSSYNWTSEYKSGKTISKTFTGQNRKTSIKVNFKNGSSRSYSYNFITALANHNVSINVQRLSTSYGSAIDFSYDFKGSGSNTTPSNIIWSSDRQGILSTSNSFNKSDIYAGAHVINLTLSMPFEDKDRVYNTTIEIDPIANISATILTPNANQSFNLDDPIHFSALINKNPNNQIDSISWSYADILISNNLDFNNSKIVFDEGSNIVSFKYSIEDHFEHKEDIEITINYPGNVYDIGNDLTSNFNAVSKNEHSFIKSSNVVYYFNNQKKELKQMNDFDINNIIIFPNSDFIKSNNNKIMKMNVDETELNAYSSEPNTKIEYFEVDEDDNIYFTESKLTSPYTVYLVKLSSSFQLIWRKNLNNIKSLSTNTVKSSNVVVSSGNIYVALSEKFAVYHSELLKLNVNGDFLTHYGVGDSFVFLESDDEGGVYFTSANITSYKRYYLHLDKNSLSQKQYATSYPFQGFKKYKTSKGIFFKTYTNKIPLFGANFNFVKYEDGRLYTDFVVINDEIFSCNDTGIYKIDNDFNIIWERKFETKEAPLFRHIKELNGQVAVYAERNGKLWEIILDPNDGSFQSYN